MRKNTIKGIAPGVKKSVYPNGIRTQKEWVESHTSKRFNDTFYAIKFAVLNQNSFDISK
jgi:hypothetical protein